MSAVTCLICCTPHPFFSPLAGSPVFSHVMVGRAIGDPIKRNEDPRLLRGGGRYVADVRLPGMLHAAILRSPHAHASIRRLDLGRARALDGVELVCEAAELGQLNQPSPLLIPHPSLTHPRTQLPLARDEV